MTPTADSSVVADQAGSTSPKLIESTVEHDGYRTHYLRAGSGPVIVLLHGSGPGVSGRANWALTMTSDLARQFTLIAPDIVGYGATGQQPEVGLSHDNRVEHIASFLRALDLAPVRLVGNSMGGGISLGIAARYPGLVARMVLMGSAGVSFPLTREVDQLYGYTPTEANMRAIFELMAFDSSRVTPELVRARYEATTAPEVADRWARMFPPPRQRHIDEAALPYTTLEKISTPTLLIHGAQDRVVPVRATSLQLVEVMPNADLVVLGRCGHWAQVERGEKFRGEVARFFSEAE
ncbi:MAG TPA: alpha/beta hydrolase [Amycolatopsis sp.]|uniref:alpha/beta fold hydrolase n=1 Tax=Amycolatopsis sp. TaxID=37632 RepID=UPI002B486F47|nr:alpha/beta hydrolase [Amycolatopsis sp.]HKS49814.1 alpha/beta hydrolase [Amycolatopsis sp.]